MFQIAAGHYVALPRGPGRVNGNLSNQNQKFLIVGEPEVLGLICWAVLHFRFHALSPTLQALGTSTQYPKKNLLLQP